MSAFGERYFHTDEAETIDFLIDALNMAKNRGVGIRFYNEAQTLQVKVGGGMWTYPFRSTPDYARDC